MERIYAVIGLGYVGLELAMGLSKTVKVIGYDNSPERIEQLIHHYDKNKIFTKEQLQRSVIEYKNKLEDLKQANFYIVVVPTPVCHSLPDLECLIKATRVLAGIIKKGDIIVYESTVYPGTTEEICIKLLEDISQMTCGEDFNVGYSPERINPNDTAHTLSTIVKIVSAQNQNTLREIVKVYQKVSSVYPVMNIKVAEAAKVLENTQRDVNIAFMNEFARIMHALDINVQEVLDAAKTKWNFSDYKPGLVGGHCIAVDPLYLAFKAKQHGVEPSMILTARRINDDITHFIIEQMIKLLIKNRSNLNLITIGILGVTYKEDIPDIRNSLMLKLISELDEYQINYVIHDPHADKSLLLSKYHLKLVDFADLQELDVLLLGVGHTFYLNHGLSSIVSKLKQPGLFMDIPSLFKEVDKSDFKNIIFWNL
ncbi:nucleotide sugar dehydrogenase [Legionella oakridgensis]|uniref:Nucleotide sugar dehydrogenase n=2 Tax=Legionella oakridgensis TaxID=29423 RepID=W0BD40_9GAMM|nr:nucleotide sugar dehydrogenase [Legionella oakridgensis]AHE66557.1 nucleotide sugar dehydrogenase [Legionella oakridgensis ATCC 33761 = DSM 21215]KTD37835.1 protein capL [Legionella oakridgensis]STY19712.1 protein capL [Legionella longbeachae]